MESVESNAVETQEEPLSDLAKAMLGAVEPEKEPEQPPTPPEMETPEPDPVTESEPDDPEAPETEPAPKTIKALAEKLGVEAAELYDLKLAMPDGAEVSIGQLKDGFQELEAVTTQRDELDERRIAFDTEISAKQSEIDGISAVINPERLTQQELDAYKAYVEQSGQREAEAMIRTTPEWKDPVQREADHKLMQEYGARFGISAAELSGIKSHKIVRLIRDAAIKSQRVKKEPHPDSRPDDDVPINDITPTSNTTPQADLGPNQEGSMSRREALLAGLTIFVLAIFIGFEVVTKVPPTLHTPLMSGSNAISGITLVGAVIMAGLGLDKSASYIGLIAVVLATINVVGGFLVTHRMLSMFRKR